MAGKPVWGLRIMVDCSAFYFSLPLLIVLPGVDKRKKKLIYLPTGVCFFLSKKKKKDIYNFFLFLTGNCGIVYYVKV